MKLRIARKIINAVGTPRQSAYTDDQIRRANVRHDRSFEARRDNAYWDALMRHMGPLGRAEVVASWNAGAALDLLIRTPEEEWEGDPTAMVYKEPR